jgi:hypothetical protein
MGVLVNQNTHTIQNITKTPIQYKIKSYTNENTTVFKSNVQPKHKQNTIQNKTSTPKSALSKEK